MRLCGLGRHESRACPSLAVQAKFALRFMQCHLRLVWLSTLARVRTAGPAPWLLFGGWMVGAALQEPLHLRRYGIQILAEAGWVAGLALLLVLLFAEARLPRRGAWLANLTLVCGVALVQSAVALLLDPASYGEPAEHIVRAGCFIVAWAPLALTLSAGVGFSRGEWLHATVVSCSLVIGCVHSIAWQGGDRTQVIIPAALAVLAASVWAAPLRRYPT